MSALRQRNVFTFSNDSDEHPETLILDDQEQEELIQSLRAQNDQSNSQYLLIARIVVALSCFLHLIYLVNPTKESPLAVIFPPGYPDPPLLLSVPFTMLHIILHAALLLLSWKEHPFQFLKHIVTPFSYPVTLAASAVAPLCSALLGRAFATTAWWSFAFVIVAMQYSVHRWVLQGEASIVELGKMKYDARGA